MDPRIGKAWNAGAAVDDAERMRTIGMLIVCGIATCIAVIGCGVMALMWLQ